MRFAPCLATLVLLATPLGAEAGGGSSGPDPGWEFSLAPYLYAISIDGSLEADRASADLHMSFSEIWDNLDFAGLVAFEAQRGRLALVTNVNYLKLSTEESRAVGPAIPVAPPGSFDVDVEMRTLIFEQYALFEVGSLPLCGARDDRRVAFDVGPALRVLWLDTDLDVKLKPGVPIGPFQRSFDASTDWVDFVATVRVRAHLADSFDLLITGDYGGFDIGSSSHRTWSLLVRLLYELGEHWDLAVGWRHLALDRDQAELRIDGPLLGAIYRF